MISPNAIPLLFAPLMAFAVYRRVRGSFGRQPIRTRKMKVRIGLFAVVIALAMTSGLQDIRLAEGVLGGAVLGAGLATFLGLRLTRFEAGEGHDFYIPNPWVGGALTALLLGRLAWRFMVLAPAMAGGAMATNHGPAAGNSPLTMTVVGLTLGYYLAYYTGLLIHHRRFRRQQLQAA
ncbi:hypothetical protein SAMN02800694_3643 [Luteibacter sp. UNCMF331Sha3.1]|uniref:DUF1453 domain-containing protein n=1 Tax=Luteibacter sp. UNCMF331Sha3.1 TaxID=1502760 RepID=UPI0008CC7203|nr:DUF1453 domain-containing protein [Luteibacter sp. UNCMF331Sha3.1]SEN50726.1 hypothetical protein SAMN02800694_3643 [Luteibacter sp. UNCMF331Sha3.1]